LNFGLSTDFSFRYRSANWLSESLKSKSEVTHCLCDSYWWRLVTGS